LHRLLETYEQKIVKLKHTFGDNEFIIKSDTFLFSIKLVLSAILDGLKQQASPETLI